MLETYLQNKAIISNMRRIRHFIIGYFLLSIYCGNLHSITEGVTEGYYSPVNNNTTPFWNFEKTKSYDDYYYALSNTQGSVTGLSLNDMDDHLLQNETQHFLSSFPSGYQRDAIATQLKFCPFTELCGFKFGLTPSAGKSACCGDCSCDFPACMINKTCCPDTIFNHANKLNNTSIIEALPKLLTGQKHAVRRDCIDLYLSKVYVPSKKSVFAYAMCPFDTDIELVRNCTRPYNDYDLIYVTDTVPVRSNWSHEVYRNVYCALCNDEPIEKLERLDLKLKCLEPIDGKTDKDILRAIYVDGKCDLEFLSEFDLDVCVTVLSDCSVKGTLEDIMCSMYKSVVYIDDIPYQNIFCAICNGVYPVDLTCVFTIVFDGSRSFTFSGLLLLDKRDEQVSNMDYTEKCSENQVYDYLMDSCKDMTCSEIAVLKHGECVQLYGKLEKITYTTFFRLIPTSRLVITEAFEVADHVIDVIGGFLNGSELCGVQMIFKTDILFKESDHLSVETSNLLYFDTRFQYYVDDYHSPNNIVRTIRNFHNTEHSFYVNSNETIQFKIQVRDDSPRKFDLVSVLSRSDEIYYSREQLNLTFLIQNYIESGNDNLTIFPHLRKNDNAAFCEIPGKDLHISRLMTCPKVNISFLESPWKEVDDGVSIINGDFRIKSIEYGLVDENHILMCVDKYRQYMTYISKLNNDKILSVESVISIACSVLSILALCFSFFVFCFFSKLRRTIPGKNNMSLILTLLFAQISYLIGSFSGFERNSTECVFFGLLIHFSWLVALFWMNICTFHLFRVLARTKVMSHSSGTRRMGIYHMYAQIMAALFVSINIAISYTTRGDLGYGRATCYLSSQEMIIYTFAVPAALIVLSNLCMFTYVAIKIKRSPSVQKSVQNERNDLLVFAKLSTITGATWVFGLLYIWTHLTAMSYIFILLNASQGVFIMFAFVINKRVIDLFKCKVLGLTTTITSEGGDRTSKSTMYSTDL